MADDDLTAADAEIEAFASLSLLAWLQEMQKKVAEMEEEATIDR